MSSMRGAAAPHSDAARLLSDARVHGARGEPRLALELVTPLLDDPALRPEALLLKADTLMQSGELEAAREVYACAARERPRSCAALNGLARCLHALGRDDDSIEVATRARALLGEGENFRYGAAVALTLVWSLREKRRHREALEIAEDGLRRWPDAVLAQWASQLEEELAEAERERC